MHNLPRETPRIVKSDAETSIVLGCGLAGLLVGYQLTRAGRKAVLFEAGDAVGGLSRTIRSGEFLYDIGGHRFFTRDREIEAVVRDLMGDELIDVSRSSKIYLRDRFFDYPLKPLNSVSGLGVPTVARIIVDYWYEKLRGAFGNGRSVSLEDWVVSNFGRTMFNIYFKEYSEKVWGIDSSRISEKWVAQRIRGLSLGRAIRNAFFRFSGRGIPTLADTFYYPRLGIGRISDRFREEIEERNTVYTSTGAVRVNHGGGEIKSVVVSGADGEYTVAGGDFISTIPVTSFVEMLRPEPPADVLDAARRLSFRDLVLVSVKVDRARVTDQTWIYIPEQKISFGRIHEPKNWSEEMAPPGKTLLVVEYFCFQGDATWTSTDEELSRTTVEGLEKLGFIKADEVLGAEVLRVPKAYPLFEVGFEVHAGRVFVWLDGLENLRIAGRSGNFDYQNMDHAIASGIEAAREIIRRRDNGE